MSGLIGYKWTGKTSGLAKATNMPKWALTFECNGQKYSALSFSSDDQDVSKWYIKYNNSTAYYGSSGTWNSSADRTITIYGGADSSPTSSKYSALYSWLSSNGTLTKVATTFDLASLGLSEDVYDISVKAKAAGFSPSKQAEKKDEPVIVNSYRLDYDIVCNESVGHELILKALDSSGKVIKQLVDAPMDTQTNTHISGAVILPINTATITHNISNMPGLSSSGGISGTGPFTVTGSGSIFGSYGCFAAGTKVLIGNNLYKNIEELNIGDTICSYNLDSHQIEEDIIADYYIYNGVDTVYNITLEDGNVIKLTSTHALYTDEGWKCVQPNQYTALNINKLDLDSMIMRADNHFVGIVSIEQDTTIQPVYHIVLANNNCLIVSGSEDHEPVLAEHYNVSVNSRVNTTTVGNVAQNDGNEDPRPAPDPGPQPYTDPVPRASLAPAWRGGIRDREFSCNLLVAQPYPS